MTQASERVWVDGLPAGMDEDKLRTIFGAYGTLKDIKSFKEKKACILVFATLDEAKWVVDNLDGNMPEGITSPVSVSYAWSRGGGKGGATPAAVPGGTWTTPAAAARPGPYTGGGCAAKGGCEGKGGSIQMLKRSLQTMGVLPGAKGGRIDDSCQVYIKGLPADTSDRDLADMFSPFGPIPPRGIKAMLDQEGQCTGVGFVDYLDADCAQAAVKALNGAMCSDGTSLRVALKNSTKGKGKGKE